MDADKLGSIFTARGRFPAIVDGEPILLRDNSTVGAGYISARGFIEKLASMGLTIDEVTLEISKGEITMVENDVPPANGHRDEPGPTPSEWEGINFKALRKRAKDAGLTFPEGSPKRAEVIAALEKAGIHRA